MPRIIVVDPADEQRAELYRFILEHPNAALFEFAAQRVGPEPVIMIARRDDDAERRVQLAERRYDLGGRVNMRRAALFADRSEEHTSELQSLMRISYAVFCLKKKKKI